MEAVYLIAQRLTAVVLISLISRVIYLRFFHPLHSYPGPLLWKVSSIPSVYHTFRGDLAVQSRRLHLIYGPIVRTGPDELSFTDPQAWKDVHGARSPEFPKDKRRVAMPPNGYYSITQAPKDDHARFRRLLAHAFSEQGLREQQPRIREYVDLMIDRLSERAQSGEDTNIKDWFAMTTFDLIGELAWGESFHCLRDRRVHEWIPAIDGSIRFIVCFTADQHQGLGWFNKYLVNKETASLRRENYVYSAEMAERRAEYQGAPRGDFWDRVLIKSAGEKFSGEGMVKQEMANNASVLVLAGADTSATTLSGVIFLLLTHPGIMTRLVQEIRTSFKSTEEIDVYSINRLKFLPAVISECMRLRPAVPAQTARVPPVGGGVICGRWVPEGTSIQVPQAAMNSVPWNFHRPDEFLPERWLPDAPPEFENDVKESFQPFTVGNRNCIGRNLANAEMRLIMAKLLFHFDLELIEQRTKQDWMDQKAWVTWIAHPLWVKLKFAPRQG